MGPATLLWFLPFTLPIAIWVAWSDMKFMKIPNNAVIALLVVYLVVGPFVFPLNTYGWGWALCGIVLVVQTGLRMGSAAVTLQSNPDGTLQGRGGVLGALDTALIYLVWALVALLLAYIVVPLVMPYGSAGILGEITRRLLPVWIALVATFALSIRFKRRLGLYGKLFDSTVGMIGFVLVMFWVYVAAFVGVFDMIVTHDYLSQVSGLKNALPGVMVPDGTQGVIPHYLLGGDNLARDIFSRVMAGSVF